MTRRFYSFLIMLLWLQGCSWMGEEGAARDTVEGFVDALAAHDYDKGKRFLTQGLRSGLGASQLAAYAQHTGIDTGGELSWTDGTVAEDHGELAATLTASQGAAPIPLRFQLSKQGNTWKIAKIERGVRTDVEGKTKVLYAPETSEVLAMVRRTTSAFTEATMSANLARVRTLASNAYRQRLTKEAFRRAFGEFGPGGVDISPTTRLDPQLIAIPSLTPNGMLLVEGIYPTKPSRVLFSYQYVPDPSGEWKLAGLNVSVRPVR